MSRLTKDIREQMARKLVQYRYADEAKELVRLNRTLADRAYAHIFTKPIQDAMNTIDKAFPNTFGKHSSFTVNAGGYRVDLGGVMRSRWVKFDQAKHDGYRCSDYYRYPPAITDEKLATEIREFATRYTNFDDVCQTAYYEAMSVLNTITTGKKLAEAWPEAMEVIGDLIPEGDRTLPVVQVSAINAKFKLPPKKNAA